MTGWGVLFDWDGVIVDSSRLHERSWELLAAEEGLSLPPDHFRRSFGMKNERIIPGLLGWTDAPAEVRRLSDRKEVLFRELVAKEHLAPLPGVHAFLAALRSAGTPFAVASSTTRTNIEMILRLTGLGGFQAIVASEDVSHGKPDPEVFLKAAAALGLAPERCVVFEDAHVGIEAARAAGARVVALATTHPADTLRDADRVEASLADVTVESIAAWFAP